MDNLKAKIARVSLIEEIRQLPNIHLLGTLGKIMAFRKRKECVMEHR
jgi:hypothetical protein